MLFSEGLKQYRTAFVAGIESNDGGLVQILGKRGSRLVVRNNI
jgi:hypothetical protein